MPSSAVRSLFVLAVLVLLLQYALVGLFGLYGTEPWPAVVLPGFKKVYDHSEAIRVERPVLHVQLENGNRMTVPPSQFLASFPRSHHPSFLEAQCRPASLSGTAQSERCRVPEGRQWFLQRADTLFPDQSIQNVTVTWEAVRFDPRTGSMTAHPLDSLRLSAP